MNDNDRLIYLIMETNYIKSCGRKVSTDINENADLYPSYWFSNLNYRKKSEILNEAINNKCLIVDTPSYKDLEEGVKRSF